MKSIGNYEAQSWLALRRTTYPGHNEYMAHEMKDQTLTTQLSN